MRRWALLGWLILAMALGGVASAKKTSAGKSSKSSKSSKSGKSGKGKGKSGKGDKKCKKGKKCKEKPRWGKRPNMPPGWEWPPNEAMKVEGAACLVNLTALGVKWEKADDTPKISTPIVVPDLMMGIQFVSIFRKPPLLMDCHLADAFARIGGPTLIKLGVKQVRFSTTYIYRNVEGMNVLSRHALGLAMDVYEFVDNDGKTHVVKTDYKKGDKLLHDIEAAENETGAFRMLLTPGNDKGHWDHFHFEARTPGERVETPTHK